MQVSKVIDQTATIYNIKHQLEQRGCSYIQEVLDASQQYLETAKEFLQQMKPQTANQSQPTLKISWDPNQNKKLLARHKQLQLIGFSCKLEEEFRKDEHGDMFPKKTMSDLPPHSKLTKTQIRPSYNGLCLKMGTQLPDGSHVIPVDVDNKNGTMEKWYNLLKNAIGLRSSKPQPLQQGMMAYIIFSKYHRSSSKN